MRPAHSPWSVGWGSVVVATPRPASGPPEHSVWWRLQHWIGTAGGNALLAYASKALFRPTIVNVAGLTEDLSRSSMCRGGSVETVKVL